jgi:pimeloyl-ACP methyl ester carboxylesterase
MSNNLLEKTINKDGCNIHYWVSSCIKGQWLVFLHGAGADHEMFNNQIKEVTEKFNVLLWDARGHGKSRPMDEKFSIKLLVEDLIEIMNKENIDKATFIGQSMGGNISQELAFYHPEKVESLVLVDCSCNTMRLSNLEKFYLKLTPFLVPLYPWNYLVSESVRASAIDENVQIYLRNTFNRVGKKDFTKILLETTACLHYEEGYTINKSMLLVYGESDKTGNIKKIAPAWAASEPNCELVKINNASHCSNQDNPLEFNKALIEFLNKQYK